MSHPASFVWLDAQARGRNLHAYFRRELTLAGVPSSARLNVFADTHYELRVNGRFVGWGPVRFYPEFPEYDTYDLKGFLRKGRNVIAIHAAWNGVATFHTFANRPGFVAWGEARSIDRTRTDLATPGEWVCVPASGYDGESPKYSFAQGPIHLYDERLDVPGWDGIRRPSAAWRSPVVVPWQDAWGTLRPRSIPPLEFRELNPTRLMSAWTHRQDETLFSFRMLDHYERELHVQPQTDGFVRTRIFSPRTQTVTVGLHWGDNFINGKAIKKLPARPEQTMRQDAELPLRKGWNEFLGHCGLVHGVWEFQMSLPSGAGLKVSPNGRVNEAVTLEMAGPFPRASVEAFIPLKEGNLKVAREWLDGRWRSAPNNPWPASPAKGMVWAEPDERLPLDAHCVENLPAPAGRDTSFIFDMGRRVLGRIFVEFDAPAGTAIDVGHAEELKGDRPWIYKMCLVHAGERHIARGGQSRLETFCPRGFRYLQLTVGGHRGPVKIRRVGIVTHLYPHVQRGAFSCSDTMLNDLWEMGWRTLRLCSEDVYTDCPWRERTLYAGDLLVEFATALVTSGDTTLARRCLEIFIQSQSEKTDWQQSMAPMRRDRAPLVDYPLITLLASEWYMRVTGDLDFAKTHYPTFRRMMESARTFRKENGLYQGTIPPFIDHVKQLKDGQVIALNALVAGSFDAFGRWATTVGEKTDATVYRRLAKETGAAVARLGWDAKRGAFADALVNGQRADAFAMASSNWASFFNLTTPAQERSLQRYFRKRIEEAPGAGRAACCTPYGAFYFLGGLYEHGHEGMAEDFIRRYWGTMHATGSDTVWEDFGPDSSLTHAWSSAPTYYLSTRALGVRIGLPDATRLDEILIAPQSETLTWAEGVVPHPRGEVRVAWRVEGERLLLDCTVPPGVRRRIEPQGRLATLELWVNGRKA